MSITLGTLPISRGDAFDADSDGMVTVDELVQAVTNALLGCGVSG